MAKCPVCEKKYKKQNATVLEIGQKRNTVHFSCEACRVSSLVFVSQDQMGSVGVGILTDLSGSEAKNVFQKESVSTDHVLSVYSHLETISASK